MVCSHVMISTEPKQISSFGPFQLVGPHMESTGAQLNTVSALNMEFVKFGTGSFFQVLFECPNIISGLFPFVEELVALIGAD